MSYKVLTKQPYKISIWTFSKFSKLFYKIYFSNDSAIPTEFQFRGAPVNLYLLKDAWSKVVDYYILEQWNQNKLF